MLYLIGPDGLVNIRNEHMRLVHLKTGHFDEKINIGLKETLILIEIPIDLVESLDLCNILSVVLTFHFTHEGALGSKYCWSFAKLNYKTQKPS